MARPKKEVPMDVVEIQTETVVTPSVSLQSTAYALVEKNGLYQFVKFNFDADSRTMGNVEVINEGHSQFDVADELLLAVEEEVFQ